MSKVSGKKFCFREILQFSLSASLQVASCKRASWKINNDYSALQESWKNPIPLLFARWTRKLKRSAMQCNDRNNNSSDGDTTNSRPKPLQKSKCGSSEWDTRRANLREREREKLGYRRSLSGRDFLHPPPPPPPPSPSILLYNETAQDSKLAGQVLGQSFVAFIQPLAVSSGLKYNLLPKRADRQTLASSCLQTGTHDDAKAAGYLTWKGNIEQDNIKKYSDQLRSQATTIRILTTIILIPKLSLDTTHS